MTRPSLDDLVAHATDTMIDVRRDLHQHPELAFKEVRTTAVVRDRLGALGLDERPCPTTTGAVAELVGGRPGATILLRADLDALPIDEVPGSGVTSEVDGVMHACGHDAHTAALLGVAEVLASRAEELPGRYVFIFQPAEESLGGARSMLDGGVLDGVDAKAMLGCHVTTLGPVGFVGIRHGVTMSEARSFSVEATGSGGHGAMASDASNPLLAVAQLACELPLVVEGLEHDGSSCACSAGVLRAGSAANVVPSEAMLRGTLRTFTADHAVEAVASLHRRCDEIARAFGCELELTFGDHAPAVVNDEATTDVVRRVATDALGASNVLQVPPVTPSDDVSEFLARVPGCYFFVGAGPKDRSSGPHHSPTFSLDDGCLGVAARVLSASAVALAGAETG